MDGEVAGTPEYMPPEQANGEVAALGPHSDVYGMGAILYTLLAGHPPYVPDGTRRNPYAVLARVQEGPPRSLGELGVDVAPELEAICEKAMARRIPDRYPDMEAFATDLRAYLERRVVSAYATGPVQEFRKWVARNPVVAAAAAAVVAAVLGLGGWALKERGE